MTKRGMTMFNRPAHPAIGVMALLFTTMAGADAPPCEPGPGYEPVCGIAPPEDMELAADARHLFMSITPGLGGQHRPRLRIMDLQTHQARDLDVAVEPEAGWGEATCPTPPQALGAHGIHLSERPDGRQQLLVVNHDGREAIEFVEVLPIQDGWTAVWRGCVENTGLGKFNDVAATPDGGFVATVMFESESMKPPMALEQLLDGRETGYLMTWAPGKPLTELAGSRAPFPNGIQVSKDGRHAWFAAWTASEIWQYDLESNRVVSRIPVGYMVDNLSWAQDGRLLGAGINDVNEFIQCFIEHTEHCAMGITVSALDTTSEPVGHEVLFTTGPGVLAGASVAVEVGSDIYVGTFTSDRLLRLTGE
ncbi:hypothetical protein BVH74_16320 [Halopseudomonas phragmitis]|uniref:SMP-30/Gluconolactonase/LRE-like region domain-containing protein n=2 Tax=Halopseudomonas phragmitis TaxID=1931241 RepID=A0A1V0B8J1_9GAMM|nr:hypothetical protein BVH74_16320 [Halopseudomonas phragmitis]